MHCGTARCCDNAGVEAEQDILRHDLILAQGQLQKGCLEKGHCQYLRLKDPRHLQGALQSLLLGEGALEGSGPSQVCQWKGRNARGMTGAEQTQRSRRTMWEESKRDLPQRDNLVKGRCAWQSRVQGLVVPEQVS